MISDERAHDASALDPTGIHVPQGTQRPGPEASSSASYEETVAPELGVPSGAQADTDVSAATGAYEPRADLATQKPGHRSRTGSKPGQHVGRYVLRRFHAKGGMGEIWRAEDTSIGRTVALKQLFGKRPEQKQRFLIEAKVTGQLEHPGIVPVHELGQNDGGRPFYVMKFVHGRTLKKAIAEFHSGKQSDVPREVQHLRLLQTFVSLVQTVAYAHSRGVLHRDLKPENVMLGPYGETLLLDWGLAKLLGEREPTTDIGESVKLDRPADGTETTAGSIMGSPSYMAPEVAAGLTEEVDEQSDVYLLGATLYEILTGSAPRQGTALLDLLEQARSKPVSPPRSLCRSVSRPLDAICMKAMAFRKEDRYPDAQTLADDVQRYLAGEPVSAYRERLHERLWRWAKLHRRGLAFVGAILLVLGLGLLTFVKVHQAEVLQRQEKARADRLALQDQARSDAQTFRRLADDARFYAATSDPVNQHAPYFDPRRGEDAAEAALGLAEQWGLDLSEFPLDEDRDKLRGELGSLLTLLAQAKSRTATRPEDGLAILRLLDQATVLQPASPGVHRLRSQVRRLMGDDANVAEAMQLAEGNAPATALDHFLLGNEYRAAASKRAEWDTETSFWKPDTELLQKAVHEFRSAVQLDANDFWSHFQLGRCYQALGQGPEAVETLGTCVALKPESPWGYTGRAMALIYLQRYAEAEWDLNRVLQLLPENRVARLHRGVVYWREGKRDLALEDFTDVLEPPAEKRLPEAAFYRGQLYLQEGDQDRALEDFNLVAAERPQFGRLYEYRCQVHLARGEDELALGDLNAYLAERPGFNPNSREAFEQRGHLLRFLEMAPALNRKKAELAAQQLANAIKQGSTSAAVFDDLGAMLEKLGRVKEATAAYAQGLVVAPDDTLLLVKRGWALEQLDRLTEAEADFEHALRVSPKHAEAHAGLGYLRVRRAKPGAEVEAGLAVLHGSDSRVNGPIRYLIFHNTACIYAQLSQSDKARRTEHEDMALALLQRAIELWREGGKGPNEIKLIEQEPAFKQELRRRPEFQKLIEDKSLLAP